MEVGLYIRTRQVLIGKAEKLLVRQIQSDGSETSLVCVIQVLYLTWSRRKKCDQMCSWLRSR